MKEKLNKEIKIIKNNKKDYYKIDELFNNIYDALKYVINNTYEIKEINNIKKHDELYIMEINDLNEIIDLILIFKEKEIYYKFRNYYFELLEEDNNLIYNN